VLHLVGFFFMIGFGYSQSVSADSKTQAILLILFNWLRYVQFLIFLWCQNPTMAKASSFTLYTTVGRTPLDEWSASRRELYLKTHNTQNRQTSMPTGGSRTHDLSRWAAADTRLIPRGHRDRQLLKYAILNKKKMEVNGVRLRPLCLRKKRSW
jgi:hypothetical protein